MHRGTNTYLGRQWNMEQSTGYVRTEKNMAVENYFRTEAEKPSVDRTTEAFEGKA